MKLYDHERSFQAKREAGPKLYEALHTLVNVLDREAVARLGIEQEVLAAVCALNLATPSTSPESIG